MWRKSVRCFRIPAGTRDDKYNSAWDMSFAQIFVVYDQRAWKAASSLHAALIVDARQTGIMKLFRDCSGDSIPIISVSGIQPYTAR